MEYGRELLAWDRRDDRHKSPRDQLLGNFRAPDPLGKFAKDSALKGTEHPAIGRPEAR